MTHAGHRAYKKVIKEPSHIRAYCEEKKIVYLTTVDFLWYAWQKGMLTPAEISAFITEVKQKGSKLPEVDIEKYVCKTVL